MLTGVIVSASKLIALVSISNFFISSDGFVIIINQNGLS